MQGARMEYRETDQNDYNEERAKLKLNYLNIPVSIKYNVYDKLTVLAGPQIGMLLSAKAEYDYRGSFNGVIESISENSNIKNNVYPIAFSFNLGASYGFSDNFFIDARYNIGLSNIFKMEDDFGDTINLKNNVIQFSLGYLF
jgi:opacity protein-like surface antigen